MAAIATVAAAGLAAWGSVHLANKRIREETRIAREHAFTDDRALFFKELQSLREENKELRQSLTEERTKVAELTARLIVLEGQMRNFKNGH